MKKRKIEDEKSKSKSKRKRENEDDDILLEFIVDLFDYEKFFTTTNNVLTDDILNTPEFNNLFLTF